MPKFDFREQYTLSDLEAFLMLYNEKPKLNLGCNTDIRSGYINVDCLDELKNIDLFCDVRCLSFIPSNTAVEILAYDVLEHLSFADAGAALNGWVRILKPGGKIYIRVPDLDLIANRLLDSRLPTFDAQKLIYGGQDYSTNFHQSGYTSDYLEGMLIGAGCKNIIQRVHGDDENPKTHNLTLLAVK